MTLSPQFHGVLADMDAQNAARQAIDGKSAPEEALLAVQGALELAEEPSSFAARVEHAAMRFVLLQPLGPLPSPTPDIDDDDTLFEQIASLWLFWLQGNPDPPFAALRREVAAQGAARPSGAVLRRTLILWLDALGLLFQGELDASRRLWRRSLDLSASFGTGYHSTILWSYIATFFPTTGRAFLTSKGTQVSRI